MRAEFKADVPITVRALGGKTHPRPDWQGILVDRLPVLVSGVGISQLLTVGKLPSETGQAQGDVVINALKESWGIEDTVRALCFDTTSSNTGRLAGACVLIEQGLAPIFYFLLVVTTCLKL